MRVARQILFWKYCSPAEALIAIVIISLQLVLIAYIRSAAVIGELLRPFANRHQIGAYTASILNPNEIRTFSDCLHYQASIGREYSTVSMTVMYFW